MVRLHLALAFMLGALLVVPQAATGGGWWSSIHLDRSRVAAGDSVALEATVAFRSNAAAEAAQQADRFYVYLLRGFDYAVVGRAMRKPSPNNWWSLGDAEAIKVAPVTVRVLDGNLARASAEFTVPDLPPATYDLMLCDAACTAPLPDVIPAKSFTVVADPATARLASRVERLEGRNRKQAGQLAAARADTDRAVMAARNAHSELEQLTASVSSLENRGGHTPLSAAWAYTGWFAAGALAGALALLVRRRRRPRRPRPARSAEWHPSDEELEKILS